MMKNYLLLLLLPTLVWGQLGISGELAANRMIRTDGEGNIDLPFRLVTSDFSYALNDFDFHLSLELQGRWVDRPAAAVPEEGLWHNDSEKLVLYLDQYYVSWYPNFGEVSLGNMIHAWGAADANNPTDNLSPYDFYYLFEAGTDRKMPSLSASIKAYLGDLTGELVVIPEHAPNRLPHGEPDFPITIPAKPDDEFFAEMDNELELGLRVEYAMGIGDLSASYFTGHDRMFNPVALYFNPMAVPPMLMPTSTFGYRETQVLGLDGVFFPGNWSLRGEVAYFQTTNAFKPPENEPGWTVLDAEAAYTQYVLQAEYQFANELQLMLQLIGTEYGEIDGTTLDPATFSLVSLSSENFQPGMGTPFAMISDRIFIVSTQTSLWDSRLEPSAMLMFNIEDMTDYDPLKAGIMTNLGVTYTPLSGLDLNAYVVLFEGEGDHQFALMKDFSHFNLGVTYAF